MTLDDSWWRSVLRSPGWEAFVATLKRTRYDVVAIHTKKGTVILTHERGLKWKQAQQQRDALNAGLSAYEPREAHAEIWESGSY